MTMTDLISVDVGVRQLQARFIDAAWRQDADDFAACWTKDGVWKIAGMEMVGREAIADACRRMLGRCKRIQLVLMPAIIELDGAEAIGRHHVIEFATMQDDSGFMTFGVYHDRFAEEDGRWRFKHRHWSMKYRGEAPLAGLWTDTSDYGSFPQMPGPDEPTYVRPA
jgi:uncharacterized protein (TIGR02246 family)